MWLSSILRDEFVQLSLSGASAFSEVQSVVVVCISEIRNTCVMVKSNWCLSVCQLSIIYVVLVSIVLSITDHFASMAVVCMWQTTPLKFKIERYGLE